MPGLNLLAAARSISPDEKWKFSQIQERMRHSDSYAAKTLLNSDRLLLGITAYDSYPQQFIDTPAASIAIEGVVYNRDAQSVEEHLVRVADALGGENVGNSSLIDRIVSEWDGDFIIVVHCKESGRILVLNDSVGRLPFFYAKAARAGGSFVASREVKFILPFLESIEFRTSTLLEYLAYGFPFGENTLVDGVSMMRPSTLLVYDPAGDDLEIETFRPPSLHRIPWTGRTVVANTFKEKFIEGLSSRLGALDGRGAVVSLSGGLDSRALLAGMLALGRSPRVLTMQGPEEALAKDIAQLLGVEIETIPSVPDAPDDLLERSIFLKDGLDSMATQGQLLFNVTHMASLCGRNTVYYTGMFGGELTRYLNPTSGIGSTHALAQHVVDTDFAFRYSTEKACRMLGLSRDFVIDHVGRHLDSFGDESPYDRYTRFRFEFDRKWTGQGEDRNRFFFWTVAPFTARPFLRFALSVKENNKDTRLFRDFLHALDPRTCLVKYYNLNLPLDSPLTLFAWSAAERLTRYPSFKKMLYLANRMRKPVRQRKRAQSRHMETIRSRVLDRLHGDGPLEDRFRLPETRHIVAHENDEKGLMRLYILFTSFDQARDWCAERRRAQR